MIRLKRIISNKDDKATNWWIVRKPNYEPINALWVPELSPTPELFSFYSAYYEQGTWTKRHFDELYVPRFLEDLKGNKKGLELLKELKERSFKEDIYLCCYCENEDICHRSIIGGILKGVGANIDCDEEYLKYYQMFKC